MNHSGHLLLLTPDAQSNSTGRTYCLWLLARALGWRTTVVAVVGESVWEPLLGTEFAEDVRLLADLPERERTRELERLAREADLLLAIKPVADSFGLGLDLARRTGKPLAVDVDDLDIEVRLAERKWRSVLRHSVLGGRNRQLRKYKRATQRVPVTVCCPSMQELYGGLVLPHARVPVTPLPASTSRDIVVRFVGSPRGHKGIEVLREAVARFGGDGVRLEVTAPAPSDAAPWEGWLGTTSIEEGKQLVATSDVVVLPSHAKTWAMAQLPAKLMDAMLAGRPVVASNLAPLAWALGDTGVLVEPGDVDALHAALVDLRDPALRARLGAATHARGMKMFTVEALAPAFGEHLERAAGLGAGVSAGSTV